MAKEEKMSMPSGIGGLVRYFDDYKSKIEFAPQHVLFAAGVIIALMVLLHMFG